MKPSVPSLDTEAARADEQLLAHGFHRAHWEDVDQTLYVLRLGLWAVRVWFRPYGAQLELGTLEAGQYIYRSWSIPIDPSPSAVVAEALQFAEVTRHLGTPGDCGVE